MRRNSGIIGPTQKPKLTTAPGVHEIFDHYNSKVDNAWPKVKKLVSCSPNSGNHYEGEQKSFTVTVNGYEDGDTVYYTIASVSGTVNTTDFSDNSISGSFTVNSSGVGSFSKTLNRDGTSETESYKFEFREGSISGNIFGESGTFTIPNPSYTLTASPNSSPNEGDTVTFFLTGTNAYTGTHYYSLSGTAANANDLNSNLTGSFSYNNGTGSFQIAIDEDYLTEGSETFTAYARVNNTSGPIVAQTTVTINDTSPAVSATCTPNVSTVNEGSNVTFTVNTTNFTSGTLNWDTVLSADMETSDISATSGTVSISGSTGSIVITATSDGYTETGQTESFQVRVYDPLGAVMVTSSAVTINDTSTGTPEPVGAPFFNWRYYAYGSTIGITYVLWRETNGTASLLRSISGQQHTNSTSTWDTYSENLSSYSGTTGRIYIAYKTGTNFYNDPQFDNMELVDTTAGTISLDPGTSTGRGRWEKYSTYTSTLTPPTTSYSSIPINTITSNIWNYDVGGTPSSSTGGIYDANGSSSGYYLYFEGSSPNFISSGNRYYWVRMISDYTLR